MVQQDILGGSPTLPSYDLAIVADANLADSSNVTDAYDKFYVERVRDYLYIPVIFLQSGFILEIQVIVVSEMQRNL